ncbi:hypothetical protein Sango_3016600 [Sesamum angolense]|uniref:Uncharacterized protein n=1 Tax=Sesamum angolense TaxID=2727404 RepID=A0AAE1T0X7_9LAMI|nr:hypothetical protein Sango_3016600 [Sesamum angolense]
MPKAVYTLTKEHKRICEWITHIKFPDGYGSNLVCCVDMKELRVNGMKSHDCHIFMHKLISITFRKILPKPVWGAFTKRSFFNKLYDHHHSEDHIIEELVATQFKDWFKHRVKFKLNYTDNELLELHYWGPTAEFITFPCYFVNGNNFHIERHSVDKLTMNYADSDFDGILEEII